MKTSSGILVVDHDEVVLNRTLRWLRSAGFPAVGAVGGDRARLLLHSETFDLLVTKARLGVFSGIRLMQIAYLDWPHMPVVLLGDAPDQMLDMEARRYNANYAVAPQTREGWLGLVTRVLPAVRPRQRWPRKRLPLPLPLRIRHEVGSLVDASYGGLCFEMAGPTQALPATYDVAVDTFGLQVTAQTVWARRESGRVICGAMLVSPQTGDHARWRQLVDLLPESSAGTSQA